jgi:hypothetical protein
MLELDVRSGALSIRPFQVSRWRLRRTRHPWVLNADLVRRYQLEGGLVGWRDRLCGGLTTGARPDIAEILAVSLVIGPGEASRDTRLVRAAQQYELWTFVEVKLRTVN